MSREIATPSRTSFAELGWAGDVVLDSSSSSTVVEFQLPADAEQGKSAWYAVYLAYEWSGVLPPDKPAYLTASWNEQAVYQMKVKRHSGLPNAGYEWSVVDAIWGRGGGWETSPTFHAASTNFATISGVRPGRNVLRIDLDLPQSSVASEVSVRILEESSVISTGWGPANVLLSGNARVKGRNLDLDIEVVNKGLNAPGLSLQTVVFYDDGGRETFIEDFTGVFGALESRRLQQSYALRQSGVSSAYLLVDWKVRRNLFEVWPERDDGPFLAPLTLSLPGVLIATTLLWITVPGIVRSASVFKSRVLG